MNVESFPRAGAHIIEQFRYYLVKQDAPTIAVRFSEAAIESINQVKAHSPDRIVVSGARQA